MVERGNHNPSVVGSIPTNATKSIFRVCIPIGRGDGLRSHPVVVQIHSRPPTFAGLVSVEERRFRKPDVLRPNRRTGSTLTFFASSSKAIQRPIVRSKRHLKSFGAGCRESPERHREDHFRDTRAWTATRGLVAFRKEEATSNQGMIGPSQRGVAEQPRVISVRYAGRNPTLRKHFSWTGGEAAQHGGLQNRYSTVQIRSRSPFQCGHTAIQFPS